MERPGADFRPSLLFCSSYLRWTSPLPQHQCEFWLLSSSQSQQSVAQRRHDWLPHSQGTAGASWLSLQAVQAISPTSALPFWLPRCKAVPGSWCPVCRLERWPFLHFWPSHIPADAGRSAALWQQGPRQYTETCRAHTGREPCSLSWQTS